MKKIVCRGEGTGKTKELLLFAKEENAVILTQNAYGLREKAYAYGITGLDIQDVGILRQRPEDVKGRKVVFHKLDSIINEAFGINFVGGSMKDE